MERYNQVKSFIEANHRNPSKYVSDERGQFVNWIKHNRKLFNKGEMKEERMTPFKKLLELSERYRRKNQYV